MGRQLARLAVACLLVSSGLASALLAARPAGRGVTTTTTATATTSAAAEVLALSGHGWGHGLGLSQWGAYGYATHGWTFDRILAHYYPGTTLGPASQAALRVQLVEARQASLGSPVAWAVSDAAGRKIALDAGAVTLRPGLAVHGSALEGPLTVTSRQPLIVNGKPFRGRLVVSSDGKRLQVIDVVGLEGYLKGVVPSEMPPNWPPDALEAQAVAARSYALANLTKGRNFDVYGDTRDQAYGGVGAESPAASAAIDATKGQVVLYDGHVADTLFFSTSGGRTASAAETTGKPVPYLVSVPDPWDTTSPYHDWGPVLFDAVNVAKRLELPQPLTGVRATTGPSGRVKTLDLLAADGSRTTFTGAQIRAGLELRSTWFTPTLLQLLPQTKTTTYGGAVSITGFGRDAGSLTLEAKPALSLDWAPAGELILDAEGAFATIVRPQVTTSYRLSWGTVRAGLAKISVAPRVDAAISAAGAQGTIKPAVAGSPVQLQRSGGLGWATVSSTVADTSGAWSFTGSLASGTYRVRAAPGRGLVPGVSAPAVLP